jgi:hypothetical protein
MQGVHIRPGGAGYGDPMPKNSEPMTVPEHLRVGAYLAEVHDTLVQLHVALSNRTRKTAPEVRKLSSIVDQVDLLRSRLDDVLAGEHPEAFQTEIYYPGTDTGQRLIAPAR